MKRWRWYPTVAAAIALVCLCFFLPNLVFVIQDARSESKTETSEIGDAAAPDSEMSMVERMALVRSYDSSLSLSNGGQFTSKDEAYAHALNELKAIFDIGEKNGVYMFSQEDIEPVNGTVMLNVSSEDAKRSIVLWELEFSTRAGETINLSMDDTTGMILALGCSKTSYVAVSDYSENDAEAISTDLETSLNSLEQYFGVFTEYAVINYSVPERVDSSSTGVWCDMQIGDDNAQVQIITRLMYDGYYINC